MNTKLHITFFTSLYVTILANGQGTFVYDQQSADENTGGGGIIAVQSNEPLGQSFTPTLSSIGFIRLFLGDEVANGMGALTYVNLMANSITGTSLGTSDSIAISSGFSGYVNFLFSTPISIVPSETYFFQIEVQSGDNLNAIEYNYGYSGGNLFVKGNADSINDLWFREGIVAPEPSSISLLFLGSGVLFYVRRKFVQC